MEDVERAPDSEQDRTTEDSRHPGVEGGLPEDLIVRGLNLHEVDSIGNDREGKLQKMPYRHQGTPEDAPDATAKHCAITPIFCHVLLWRPRCVEWNEFKFDVKWRSHQIHHERRDATLGWRHWTDQHDSGFISRIHSFLSDWLDAGCAATIKGRTAGVSHWRGSE